MESHQLFEIVRSQGRIQPYTVASWTTGGVCLLVGVSDKVPSKCTAGRLETNAFEATS